MASDTTVICTTKSPLLVKQRRWEVVMHVHHPFDARLLSRFANSRLSPKTCNNGAAAVMIKDDQSLVMMQWASDR